MDIGLPADEVIGAGTTKLLNKYGASGQTPSNIKLNVEESGLVKLELCKPDSNFPELTVSL